MNDLNKLAQRIVAKGVGEYREWQGQDHYMIAPATDKVREHGTAKWFCNDGRVVLALMERIAPNTLHFVMDAERKKWQAWQQGIGKLHVHTADSLAVAICKACCEALEGDAK